MGVDHLQPGEARQIDYHPPMNVALATPMFILAGALFVLFVGRTLIRLGHRRRLREILRTDKQGRFKRRSTISTILYKHVFHAPILSIRHSRYLKLGNNIHMGILPLRFEAALLAVYIAINIVFFFVMVDWWKDWDEVIFEFQYSAGSMAVLNLPGLVLAAGRNNPLVPLLGIKFDCFNLMHRWVGRTIIFSGLVHMIAAVIMKVSEEGGLVAATHLIWTTKFFVCGLVAIFAFTTILFQSLSPVRHAFYEAFLHSHIALAIMAFVGLWYHLDGMSQQYAMLVTVVLWGFDRATRLACVMWRNFGTRCTKATVELLPGDVARVNVTVARPWRFKAGQYAYLYMPTVGLWTSHPFSVAWTSKDGTSVIEKSSSNSSNDSLDRAVGGSHETTVSFLVKGRGGLTSKLVRKAGNSPERRFDAITLAEGPYGGLESLDSYGSVLLVAGGIGITHPVAYLLEIVNRFASRSTAVRRVTLVWVVRSLDHLSWVQPWMISLFSHPGLQGPNVPKQESFIEFSRLSLSIKIYLSTRDSSPEDYTPSESPWAISAPTGVAISINNGRPCFQETLEVEMAHQVGAMAVSVCGPGEMGDDVRQVVREKQGSKKVDFYEETFSW
ncbi:hypothetical protein CBS115989_2301 [Aspergillus niger]|uniref:ferric-chelate reductase (NADPH) n=2 Tax=Aspergillus niger TaxID=5061 RepID=A2QH08_ASPNC|nr:uncharacterized protein An03g05160 [Aspergillus niger]XP_025456544.1 uncharacterized protein BO96DRAFT_243301 [Aspergillus niger CBS 101883]KAI2822287.1 hypothetical protein CBS115989_2301 [Aspergillus niger]KAI2855556.1 hypothetical protein CBS11232_4316 [Aspergillus niger]KAI2882336.1 hypothetical protein CBS115988_263 [Aspergillus niger]KAI2886852.1 hypothetical protein CBS11852_7738 [Aspergillus niger]KAI2928376.1 hypothetical protein CBS147320_4612 [Aspergillus niger]|eukprot:XP_001390397.1 ferric-chelate reductase [Aspergillus niger CBS 513.88]